METPIFRPWISRGRSPCAVQRRTVCRCLHAFEGRILVSDQTIYNKIKFQDVNGQSLGASREPFTAISADSMVLPAPSHPAARCSLVHWQISTRWRLCYPENGRFLGHAVFVVDVAVNKNGKKAFLLAEGNTPARDIHLIRNLENPFRSPWFISDGSEKRFLCPLLPSKQLTWDTIECKGKKSQLRW